MSPPELTNMFPSRLLTGFIAGASLLAPMLAPASTPSLPASVRAEARWQLVGSDELRLFGVRIYQASLWSPDGEYRPSAPLVFNLLYRRGFSREELVEITDSAWQKLGTASESRQQWSTQLETLWQDVEVGDVLTTVVTPGGETRFHNESGSLGRIDDPAFGPAFLAIWLDPRTQLPDLRESLLGLESR